MSRGYRICMGLALLAAAIVTVTGDRAHVIVVALLAGEWVCAEKAAALPDGDRADAWLRLSLLLGLGWLVAVVLT